MRRRTTANARTCGRLEDNTKIFKTSWRLSFRLFLCTSLVWVSLLALFVAPVNAQQEAETLVLGKDHFLAGGTVTFNKDNVDDLFMAGETVHAKSDISGSAHLAGRSVEVMGTVGGDAYLAGMNLVLGGKVVGDATLAGYDARVGEVGGDLRLAGSVLVVQGPVAGCALIDGDEVRIEGPILGDVLLKSRTLSFSDEARIEGQLILFEEELGMQSIPTRVAPEDRIERREIWEWEDSTSDSKLTSWSQVVIAYCIQVLVISLLAILAAGVAPQKIAGLRRTVFDHPIRALMRGFFVESAVMGSCILFAMTLIGIVLIPISLLVTLVLGGIGYVVAVYCLGVGLLLVFGRPEPDGFGTRALAAVLGAVVARSLALIPFLGWFTFLALTLVGVGAFTFNWCQAKPVLANGS